MQVSEPFFTITARPDLQVLIIRWLREVSTVELHQGYEEVARVAQQQGLGHWLVDSRRRAQADAATVEWLSTFYLPSLAQRLGQPARLACLTAASRQPGGMAATPLAVLAQRTTATRAQGFEVKLFEEEGAAVQWLRASA